MGELHEPAELLSGHSVWFHRIVFVPCLVKLYTVNAPMHRGHAHKDIFNHTYQSRFPRSGICVYAIINKWKTNDGITFDTFSGRPSYTMLRVILLGSSYGTGGM